MARDANIQSDTEIATPPSQNESVNETIDTSLADSVYEVLQPLIASGNPAGEALLRAWLLERGGRGISDARRYEGMQQQEALAAPRFQEDTVRSKITAPPDITVIIPTYNEEENISELYRRLKEALDPVVKYELLFINNGSEDGSSALLLHLRHHDARIRILNLSRNFGHQGAVTAGLDYCRGKAVIIMDGDLQDPPEVLPEMVRLWREGIEVVYAVRKRRKENLLRRSSYYAFYRVLRYLANIDIPPDAGDFCLMDSRVVQALRSLPERNRFTRGLRVWVGFRHSPLPYERAARFAGDSKYGWSDYFRFAVDGMLAFSGFPLRLATYLGFVSFVGGLVYLAYALYARWTDGSIPRGWTANVALILLVGGSQLLVLGVLGEYVVRIYDETKRRPVYVVSSFLD